MVLNGEFELIHASLLHRDRLSHSEAVSKLLIKETQLSTLKAQYATLSTPTDAVSATFTSSLDSIIRIVTDMINKHQLLSTIPYAIYKDVQPITI